MKQSNDFMLDMLDLGVPEAMDDVLWRACKPTAVCAADGTVEVTLPFQAQKGGLLPEADPMVERRPHRLLVRAYGDSAVRLSIAFAGAIWDDSPMLQLHSDLAQVPLEVQACEDGWDLLDPKGHRRAHFSTADAPIRPWGGIELPAPQETLNLTLYPDGTTAVPVMAYDQFYPQKVESLPLAYVSRRGVPHRAVFSLHAEPNETFAGTGERFAKLDLSGRTLVLENTDALGVNNRRAYKNVPFFLSSRPYGLLIHTASHVRLSLAGISTRAAQGLIEEPGVDLFVISGGSVERVLYGYRGLTGFPAEVPLWSYGTWMSRMTYFSADEVREIAGKLRAGGFPCDVLHLDTGWFAKDWVCEWEFSEERFPDPAGFMAEMRNKGFRISLWQTPNIGPGNRLLEEAKAKRYLAPLKAEAVSSASDFSAQGVAGQIDFTNPEAVAWYQGLLKRLLKMGASAIKTDFGENLDTAGDYYGLPAEKLHNLYGLLYQHAAFEITEQVTGEGIVWARTSWTGCQRYPVHWGGDCACTWDGMAGSLRGGLHLGLSGFAFWSHDVPGFHGVPDFMASWPTEALYMRWTQFGVFTSHLRYHGTTPREPYAYPGIADIVRKWWRLRYSLIPYLVDQAHQVVRTGLPIVRALIFHHEDDPLCWHIDDEYYFGRDFLVAPVMNDAGVRDVYLPAGEWVDLWSGARLDGGRWLRGITVPLDQMPVYVRYGAQVPIYPEVVQSTQEMDLGRAVLLPFDVSYRGMARSFLGKTCGF